MAFVTATDTPFPGDLSPVTTTTGSAAATPIPSWINYMAICNDTGVDYATAYTLSLRVAISTTLNQCVPKDAVSSDCVNLDTSQVTPVNGQTFDLCGPPGACANYTDIFNGVQSLLNYCNSTEGMLGGSVEIAPDVTIQI